MLKIRDKLSITFAVISTILLLVTIACSIYFAAFTANKTATTTLQFHDGIVLTVENGIDDSGKWEYYTDGSTTSTTTANAVTGLELSGISVSSSTADCYLRVFVVIATDAEVLDDEGNRASDQKPITDAITPKMGTNTNDGLVAVTTLLNDESTFINSLQGTEANFVYKVFRTGETSADNQIVFNKVSAANTPINLLDNLKVFDVSGPDMKTNYFANHYVKAYVSIYASTDPDEWGQGFTFTFGS